MQLSHYLTTGGPENPVCQRSKDIFNTRMGKLHDPAGLLCRRFKGIVKLQSGKYLADLTVHGKSKYLGRYVDAEEAAKAVDEAKIFLVQTMHALYTNTQLLAS